MIIVTLYTPILSLVLTWKEKMAPREKDLITYLLNYLKTKDKLHFNTLNYTPNYTLHLKFEFHLS